MPFRPDAFESGQFYHLYNRVLAGETLCGSSDEYIQVLHLLKRYTARYGIGVVAYCLMPTHYHLVVRPSEGADVSRCVQTLFNAYVQATNRRRARRGPLFEGRFRQRRIVDDDDLAQVCRYVHGNPVAAGLVAAPHDWAYSNYREWIGQRRGALVDPEAVREPQAIVGDWAAFVSARTELAGPPLPKVKEPSGGKVAALGPGLP